MFPARPLAGATSLNPNAGHHLVTADPRELAASERAGDRSWATWTYYSRRYGERGRQFTRSDSGWIATLASYPLAVAKQQLDWLAAMLAARGMPRLLLEEHLRILHEELRRAVPEHASGYAVLLQVAESLASERAECEAGRTLAALETGFRELLDDAPEDDLRAGALIGAAVADEHAGIPASVTSLLDWLGDPAQFSERWLAAVEQTVERARRSCSRH